MLNSIGIQNPGVDRWLEELGPHIASLGVDVIGSAVGHTPSDYGLVTKALADAGVAAVEANLSCPNLDDGSMFALDPDATAQVMAEVVAASTVPVGAKLSPNAEDIVGIATSAREAGADWVTLTNTAWGAAIDIERRSPSVSGVIAGYSGVGVKPIAMRCVIEVHRAMPDLPILGAGGVRTAEDVIEFVMAGATSVGLGTVHFEDPGAGRRILRRLRRWLDRHGVETLSELVGVAVS